MNIDVNKIINGTPYKRILNGYNSMKENYTQESAKAFYDIYSKENLSDVLENSRMIFSEPYMGLDFYKGIVLESSSCIFTRLNDEYNKVESFVSENAEKMSDGQKSLYESFKKEFKSYIESVDDIILISSYLKSGENETFEKDLSNLLYNERKAEVVNIDKVVNFISEKADLRTTLLYTPFFAETVESGGKLNKVIMEKTDSIITENNWSTYVLNTVIMNKLNESSLYKESVNKNIHNISVRSFFTGLMESDIEAGINNLKSTSVKDDNIILHESSHLAIENMYLEKVEAELFAEERAAEKVYIDNCIKEATDALFDLLSFEYSKKDSDTLCKGYSFIKENTTLEKAYLEISSKYAESKDNEDESFFEKSGDDKSNDDDDIDNQINDLYNDKDKDDVDTYTSGHVASTSSHIKPPKTGNIANRVQTKAQDNNLKNLEKAGKIKKVAQDVGNAAKAVAKLPIDFLKGLKAEIHKLDQMDDERRKAYLTAPGYRRSVIKKLHLALLYGGAAATNLALIPVVMTYRHFSKIKDKRMKAEAIRDLEAEIKVCDAKIEDAQQSDDKKARYQLIRIKEKLQGELVRVTTNAKYV